MSFIRFFSENIPFKLKHLTRISSWIKLVVKKEKRTIKEINYIFCSDEYLLQLNQGFLNHKTLTDIITFDNSEGKKALEGEIYISIERVQENTLKFKTDFEDELHRVMIHGVLHLIGYKDKKPSEKALMRKKEEACLSLRSLKSKAKSRKVILRVPRGTFRAKLKVERSRVKKVPRGTFQKTKKL